MQKEILIFLDACFGDKAYINVLEFTNIIEEKSSEMLLSVKSPNFYFLNLSDYDPIAR